MSLKRPSETLIAAATCVPGLSACATFQRGPIGNPNVHLPTRTVDLSRYAGSGTRSAATKTGSSGDARG